MLGRVEIELLNRGNTARVSERLRRGLQILLPGFKSQPVLFSIETAYCVESKRSLDIQWLVREAIG